jgi:hypothetical protein
MLLFVLLKRSMLAMMMWGLGTGIELQVWRGFVSGPVCHDILDLNGGSDCSFYMEAAIVVPLLHMLINDFLNLHLTAERRNGQSRGLRDRRRIGWDQVEL